jgi:aarF domain-containing kinase
MPIEELFETFDMVPLASGTIGQVHRATLSAKGAARVAELAAAAEHTGEREAAAAAERGDEQRNAGTATPAGSAVRVPQQTSLAGMAVAVKVRHPGVHEAIKYDFTVLRGLVRALNALPSLTWLHLDEMTWQFESLLAAQVRHAPQPGVGAQAQCVWLCCGLMIF